MLYFYRMDKRGISVIEVVVIVAVVGLLGVFSVIALNSARTRARDATRLSDITRLSTALELYFNDHNSYPVAGDATPLGQAASLCLGGSGFAPSCDGSKESVYLQNISSPPAAGLKGLVSCGGAKDDYCYVGNATAYRIQFELETAIPEDKLQAGLNCASESGVAAGACQSIQ